MKSKQIFLVSVSVFLFIGCAPLARFLIGTKGMQIPQLVAYLNPVLRENKIAVLGKIVMQNPTESVLGLEKIHLSITDEQDSVLGTKDLTWDKPLVSSKDQIEAPVDIALSLSILDKKSVSIYLKTVFIYKTFGLRIPIESKIAVLNLDTLRETIARPLDVIIYTKLRSQRFGQSQIDYILTIANPLSIDLILEKGTIRIHTEDGADIVISKIPITLFKGAHSNQIKGTIDIGNIFRRLVRVEVSKKRPLRFQLSGSLRVPDTNISMPFTIESVQEVNFSLFGR